MIRKRKKYSTYGEYVAHQLHKTNSEKVQRRETENYEHNVGVFTRHFEHWFSRMVEVPETSICLGARSGAEVDALRRMGIESIGMDLAPCGELVEAGDIHALTYKTGSFDFAFTNVFDHSDNPVQFAREIERVVWPGGFVLLQLAIGPTDDGHAAIEVDDASDITELFARGIVVGQRAINWRGSINTEVLLSL